MRKFKLCDKHKFICKYCGKVFKNSVSLYSKKTRVCCSCRENIVPYYILDEQSAKYLKLRKLKYEKGL